MAAFIRCSYRLRRTESEGENNKIANSISLAEIVLILQEIAILLNIKNRVLTFVSLYYIIRKKAGFL